MKLRRVYPLFLVSLALLMILPFTPLAHATLVLTSNVTKVCSLNNPCSVTTQITANSEIIIFEVIQTNGCVASPPPNWATPTPTDTIGNTYTFQISVAVPDTPGGTQSCLGDFKTFSPSGGSDLITLTSGSGEFDGQFNILDYTGFTGFGNTNTFASTTSPGTSNLAITVSDGSVAIGSGITNSGGVSCGAVTTGSSQTILTNFNCLTVSSQGSTQGITTQSTALSAGTYTDTLSWALAGVTGFGRILIELKGTGASSSSALATQCYGNCGSPAITLVNTNSTHNINFNQSITVFYEFQSNLNGFIVNASTNIAKQYLNGQQVSLAIYEAQCNAGVSPFTVACPGQQQASLNGNINPVKGRTTLTPATLQVSVGEWVAVAVTGVFSGLDLNDTNSNVALFQQSGRIPQVLSGASPASGLCGGCKTGLWAFITGNTIVGPPPPTIVISCGADLVCFLVQSILALTPSNPLLGAIFYGIAFSIATIGALAFFSMKTEVMFPTGLYVLVFVAWMTFFASIVGAIWFVVLEILITILLFSSLFGTLVSGSFSGRGKSTA